MKKVTTLILVCLYTISVTGMAVNKFYCCGELKSVSLVAASQGPENCKMPVKTDGCCDQSSQTFKVKDQHLASGSIPPANLPVAWITNEFQLFDVTLLLSVKETAAFNYHAPPDLSNIAVHVLNCTYRI